MRLIDLETSWSILYDERKRKLSSSFMYKVATKQSPWDEIFCVHRGDLDLSHLKLISDRNPTFVIEDPMNKVHMGKNKSLISSASTKN